MKNLAIGSRSFKIIQDVDVYGESLLGPACLSWESIHKNRKETKGRFGFPLKCIESFFCTQQDSAFRKETIRWKLAEHLDLNLWVSLVVSTWWPVAFVC